MRRDIKGSDIRGDGRRWVCEGLEELTAYTTAIFRDFAAQFKMNIRENLGRNDIQ
jgi:hypothetical protein